MFTRPRIIPVLLYDDRDLIKTIQFKDRTYLGDPVNAVKIFNRKRIDELSVLDIGATKRGQEPDYGLLRDIASEAFMPLSCGGGIVTAEQAHELLTIGYEKVVINSGLVRNPKEVKRTVELFGGQSVVASIDARLVEGQYKCFIHGGGEPANKTPVELAKEAERLGVGEIMINSIDRDGTMQGYDINLIRSVVESVKIPVTALGGAGGIMDLKQALQEGHAHAAAGGSMFVYYGKLRAVLITVPREEALVKVGIYNEDTSE